MSALEFFKELEQLIKDSSDDGQYRKVYIDVNLAIHSRVICAINELEALEKTIKRKDEHISELKEVHLLDQEVFNLSKEAFEQLKLEKNKEIERLRTRAEDLYADICCMQDRNIRFKNQAKKARDIIAMLYWRRKRAQRNLKRCHIIGSLSNKVCKAKEQEASFAFTDSMRVLKS